MAISPLDTDHLKFLKKCYLYNFDYLIKILQKQIPKIIINSLWIIIWNCNNNTYFQYESINAPVYAVAQEVHIPFNYSQITFFAYNNEYNFAGYAITYGSTKASSINNPVIFQCPFSAINNGFTTLQFGGTSQIAGHHCFSEGHPAPVPGTDNWITIRTYTNRKCPASDTSCSIYSEPTSTLLLPYTPQPIQTGSTISNSGGGYLVTFNAEQMNSDFSGFGIFTNLQKNNALSLANDNILSANAVCYSNSATVNAMSSIIIAINTTDASALCSVSIPDLKAGDFIIIRTLVNRINYPWSNYISLNAL